MMLKRLAFIGLLGLAACASAPRPGPTTYVTVDRPHAVSCVPRYLPPAPRDLETRGSLAAVAEGPTRYARLAADWAARVARLEELEPVVRACREAAPPP